MSRLLGRALDKRLLGYLRGNPSSKGKVMLLVTADAEGWPHVAMLSSWEVFAKDRTSIRIATYDSSKTTQNLLRNGICSLLVIDRGLACYVKGKTRLLKRHAESDRYNSIFDMKVKNVLEDKLSGTRITSGITYLKDKGVEPHEELFDELSRT